MRDAVGKARSELNIAKYERRWVCLGRDYMKICRKRLARAVRRQGKQIARKEGYGG